MKILHVITSVEPGGAEHRLLSLASGQVRRGYKVGVAYLKSSERNLEKSFTTSGVEVFSLGLTRYGQIAPVCKLKKLIQNFAPDLVHGHLPPAEVYSRLALVNNSNTPFVISKHNDERFAPIPFANYMARWVAKRASVVICISKAVRDFWREKEVIYSKQSVVIHYGIGKKTNYKNTVFRKELGLCQNHILFGFVGRLVPQKALDNLLEGFSLVEQNTVKLVIVGSGPLSENLKLMAHRLGIKDRVVFCGYRNDIPEIMTEIDVLVLGSDYEGFGLVLLEAMSAGTPILATRVSAIPEIVVDGETGLLVPPREPLAMANGIKKLLNKSLRFELGSKGRRRAVENFSLEKMIEKTKSAYRIYQREKI